MPRGLAGTASALAAAPPAEPAATARSWRLAEFVGLAGAASCPVLLLGETGCGKTHLARLIHQAGPRAAMPFVRVNCGSIPDTLFEREMFGHVRGAFTDAREGAAGFFEAAHCGTLFLDEVGEMPMAVQAKLLAALEDGAFRRLGSPREAVADVRVIAASNGDLQGMVRRSAFRHDLFYRLSVIQYSIPPLRDRVDELPALVADLLRRHAPTPVHVGDAAMAAIAAYDWPGNIRELENALRAGVVFSRGETIEPRHLPAHVVAGAPRGGARYAAPDEPTREREMIRRALDDAHGNKAAAARSLGMSRSTLWAKLGRFGA